MLLFHKISRICIFPILLICCILFSSFTASASAYNIVFPVSESPNSLFNVQVNTDNRFTASSSIFDEENSVYILSFDVPVLVTFYKSSYSSFLFSNGNYQFSLAFTPTFNKPILGVSLDYDYSTSLNPSSAVGIVYRNTFYRNVSNTTYFAIYLDNAYTDSSSQSLCNFTINYKFTVSLRSLDDVYDFSLSLSDFTFNSIGYHITTSVQPSAIHGLAFTISESVSRAIYNSSIEEDLSGIHTDVEATNLILSQIKQQDYSLYNQILSSIVSQTQNDNALQQAFISFITQQLYGSASYGFDSNMSLHIEGPIGEIVSHIWYQVIDFKTKFEKFVAANQSEAAEVNSEAESQEEALNNLQESLVVPTPSVDGVLDDLASDIASPEIESGQYNVFYFLRHSYIVKIIAIAFSLGLAGFILYGKG